MASLDDRTRTAASALRRHLERRYGPRLRAVYVYGSRARGDHRPDSDLDAAVVLDRVDDYWSEVDGVFDAAYRAFLDTDGVLVHALPFPEDALRDPDRHVDGHLAKAVIREGVRA
jgi:predicted nucleotidyltransferase